MREEIVHECPSADQCVGGSGGVSERSNERITGYRTNFILFYLIIGCYQDIKMLDRVNVNCLG